MDRAFVSDMFVLTGAPGTGKSAILNRLRHEVRCVDEPAREILAEQRASGALGTWDQDRMLFVDLLLQRSIERYDDAAGSGERVLFDRGIPDCVVYAMLAGADPTPSLAAARSFRYDARVLFLEPWSAIYEKESKLQHELLLEQGKPLLFGPADDRKAVVMEGVTPKVVPAKGLSESLLWVHDEKNVNAAKLLADLFAPDFPIPIGVLSAVDAPVYEDLILQQEQKAISERGSGDIAKLLTSGDTWKIS